MAKRMGGEERVARQHASGRLTVRERIERLFDAPSRDRAGVRGTTRTPGNELASFEESADGGE